MRGKDVMVATKLDFILNIYISLLRLFRVGGNLLTENGFPHAWERRKSCRKINKKNHHFLVMAYHI